MKKIWLPAILFLAVLMNAEVIEQVYRFEEYQLLNRDGYDFLLLEKTQPAGRTGEPALPYMAVILLLPQGQKAISMEIIRNDEIVIPGDITLYPVQPSRPVSAGGGGQFAKNETVYSSDRMYPENPGGHLTTQFLNGFACALATFTPAAYIPGSGQLSFFREIKVKLTTVSDPDFRNQKKNLKTSAHILSKVERFVQNPAMITRYISTHTSREGEYDILLITSPAFQNEFDAWIELNLKKGLRTQVATTSAIYSAVPGQDEQEKIRNFIIQEYQENDVGYVLLAGDIEVVPYRGFYCYVQSGNGYESYDIPADLYYSALDGTWDDNNNGIWGEIGEEDLLPDIPVARLPFSDLTELGNMLNKTIMYQTAPVLGELNKPLLAGENMYNNPLTWGGDYLDLLIGWHDDNGYTTEGIPEDDDYLTMYDRDLGSWSAAELIGEINQGHPFIYHAGHSNYNYCMRLNDWQITNQNFSATNGVDHNFPLIYSHGCNAGGFDQSDCIAEVMIKIANFAVVYIGSSRYGWFNEGQTEGPSAHLNREFCDALYSNSADMVSVANLESKIDTAPWVTAPGQWEEGALRWTFYGTNVLGDATLPIWTTEPLQITASFLPVITLGAVDFEVNVLNNGFPAPGLICTLVQDGGFIGTAVTDEGGNALIEFDAAAIIPGEIALYVSGTNCLITEYILQVVPAGTYVIVVDHSIFSGNDNVLEFGENALLSLTLQEIGIVGDVTNAVAQISCSDPYITVTDDLELVGTILSGGQVELADAFSFDLDNNVPDQYSFVITVIIAGNEGSWSSTLNLTAYAVDIHLEKVFISDGGNGILDPGETAVMQMELQNDGGADAYDVQLLLQTSNPFVSLQILPLQIDSIAAGGSGIFDVCSITLSASAPLGEIISFDLEIIAHNGYYTENPFDLITGLAIENFETGDFSSFDWTFAGNADWMITDAAYEGDYAARSGDIGNNNTSSLVINMEVLAESNISFWKKVSSEPNYDYLRFYINGQLIDQWSGEVDWSEESYQVQPGNRTFAWVYYKDQGVSTGQDCAWLDYIIFPAVNMGTSGPEVVPSPEIKLLGNYPNPFNPTTTISFSLTTENTEHTEHTEITIYNLKGQRVKTLDCCNSFAANARDSRSTYSVIWNGDDENGKPVSSGIYFYRMQCGDYKQSRKMLLMK